MAEMTKRRVDVAAIVRGIGERIERVGGFQLGQFPRSRRYGPILSSAWCEKNHPVLRMSIRAKPKPER